MRRTVGLFVVVIAVACGGSPPAQFEEPALETVDLPADPNLDPDSDPRAPNQRARLSGVLPGGFPDDLPVFLPASVVDFGEGGGQSWVAFETGVDPQTTAAQLRARLGSADWDGVVGEGVSTLRKGSRVLEVEITEASNGCRYQYRYGS